MSDLDRALQEIGITKWYVPECNIKLYINFLLSQSILQINNFLKKIVIRLFTDISLRIKKYHFSSTISKSTHMQHS